MTEPRVRWQDFNVKTTNPASCAGCVVFTLFFVLVVSVLLWGIIEVWGRIL